MKPRSIVKFSKPENGEENLEFVVLEDRGDRVLVELICDMPIKPTFVYRKSDLIEKVEKSINSIEEFKKYASTKGILVCVGETHRGYYAEFVKPLETVDGFTQLFDSGTVARLSKNDCNNELVLRF